MSKITIKKLICIFLVLAFMLCFCSCGKEDAEYNTLADLKGKRFAIQSGTMYDQLISQKEELKGSKISYLLGSADALAFLVSGKADAFVVDYPIAMSIIAENPNLKIIDEPLETTAYGMAFSKDSKLQYQVNGIIKRFKENGSIDNLVSKWITNPPQNRSVLQQIWAGSNGTIECYVSPDYEPFCYYDSANNIQGFEVDLILRIAKELDYKVKFVSTNFEDLLTSASTGIADVALGSISITDERKELVNFSESYIDASAVVLVRDANVKDKSVTDTIKRDSHKYFIENDRWQYLLSGIGTTLQLVIIPILSGLILGIGLFLWAYSGAKVPTAICNALSKCLSLIPGSTWLLFVFYIIFSGNNFSAFVAAVVAFSVSFSMDVYGAISGNINSIDPGQKEAAYSMGYSKFGTLFHVLLPQVLPNIVASIKGPCIGEIKMTALVEFIAVGDLQNNSDIIRSDILAPFIPIAFCTLIYALIIFVATKLLDLLIKKVNTKVSDEEKIKERLLEGKL